MKVIMHDEPYGTSWVVLNDADEAVVGGHVHDADRAHAWQTALANVQWEVDRASSRPHP